MDAVEDIRINGWAPHRHLSSFRIEHIARRASVKMTKSWLSICEAQRELRIEREAFPFAAIRDVKTGLPDTTVAQRSAALARTLVRRAEDLEPAGTRDPERPIRIVKRLMPART